MSQGNFVWRGSALVFTWTAVPPSPTWLRPRQEEVARVSARGSKYKVLFRRKSGPLTESFNDPLFDSFEEAKRYAETTARLNHSNQGATQ